MLRRFEHIENCTSGLPGFEYNTKRINAIREALLAVEAVPFDSKERVTRQVGYYKNPGRIEGHSFI